MLYNTGGMSQGFFGGYPGLGMGYRGGDTGISSANNAISGIWSSLLGNQAANRQADAGLLGSGYNAQAGLLGKIFDAQNQNQASQFGSLANLLSSMYGAKSQANASLGNSAAQRDASNYASQAGLLGQGLNSQANVINSLAGLQGQLGGYQAMMDRDRQDQEFQLGRLGALSPLLGSLFGKFNSGGGPGGLPNFRSSFGQSATWS